MKMKSSPLFAIVLVLGLVGCNTTYPSLRQAGTACAEWESDGKTMTWIRNNYRNQKQSRRCVKEIETNQVLGLMNQVIEDDEFVVDENEGDYKVAKNFRY